MPEAQEQQPQARPQPEEPRPHHKPEVDPAVSEPVPLSTPAPVPEPESECVSKSSPGDRSGTVAENLVSDILKSQPSQHPHSLLSQAQAQSTSHSSLEGPSQLPSQVVSSSPAEHREAQSGAPAPPETNTDASQQEERKPLSSDPRPPDAAREPEIAATTQPEPQSGLAQEKGPEDQGQLPNARQDSVLHSPTTTTATAVGITEPTAATGTAAAPTTSNTQPPTSPSALLPPETTVVTDPSRSRSASVPAPRSNSSNSVPTTATPPPTQDGTTTATSTSDAKMSNYPGGNHRQSMQYSPQQGYATSGMNNTHYGYASSPPPTHDPYRTSSHVATNNAMALPSMRTFDTAQQQQQQHQMANSMPVPSVPSVPVQQTQSMYYQQPMLNNPYAMQTDPMAGRYAIPPNGPGAVLAGGGRHKKEIKRRTKTGCLTCRRRRIKCDEQHPTCKNCQKSKRECLGYDPVFKNQQQQQPQSSQQPPHNPSQQTQQQSLHAGTAHSGYNSATSTPDSPVPPSTTTNAVLHNTATSYTTAPPRAAASTIANNTAYNPGPSAHGPSAPVIKTEPHHPYQTIDSTLDITSSMSTSHFPPTKPVMPQIVDYGARESPHLRGGGSPLGSFHPSPSNSLQSHFQDRSSAYSGTAANKMKVSELVAIGGATLPVLDAPLSQDKITEVLNLYEQVYALGLERFFETAWFVNPDGPRTVASNIRVQEVMAAFLQAVTSTAQDPDGMSYAANLEFYVVWELAALVYTTEYKVDTSPGLPAPNDGVEARNRVFVFETLLAGEFLDQNPLRMPIRIDHPTDDNTHRRNREVEFWYHLADFLRIKDQPGMDVTPQRDHILTQLRILLDGRENRDVLYSLAIMRTLTHKFPPDFDQHSPPHFDESDPKSKLSVARSFIQKETEVAQGGGTTNVVRRFAELAVRAFINPGSNIDRR
ncbi:hypothetical protein GGR57DRAFT_517040 [Xylariaceae sp. FL1272]|nr:hypothetical protein GGR57DRAFT_517040 [Xylariaceae sp. FL1272]